MPWKLIRKAGDVLRHGRVIPYYLQLKPTNKCNANCSYCSEAKWDRSLELHYNVIYRLLDCFRTLGTRAVSISGGGEPTVHPHFVKIIECAYRIGMEVGLTTNGLLPELLAEAAPFIQWARMSVTDSVGDYDVKHIMDFCKAMPDVDCSVSFTVVPKTNYKVCRDICAIANEALNISHVRFVADINQAGELGLELNRLRDAIAGVEAKVIIQPRNVWYHGRDQCALSLLRPQVMADGFVYPCCGIRYNHVALQGDIAKFRMCLWSEFHQVKAFCGTICDKCYYDDYNEVLDRLTMGTIKHEHFL